MTHRVFSANSGRTVRYVRNRHAAQWLTFMLNARSTDTLFDFESAR